MRSRAPDELASGLQRGPTGVVALGADGTDLFDLDAVDLADFAHQEIDQRRVRQLDHQLIDRLAFAGLQDLDADHVALDRADPAGHGAQRTRTIRQPDAQHVALHGHDPRGPV